jgi:hypothetical protein
MMIRKAISPIEAVGIPGRLGIISFNLIYLHLSDILANGATFSFKVI